MCLMLSVNASNTLAVSSYLLRRLIFFSVLFRASSSFHTEATITFLTTRQLCFSSRLVNTSLVNKYCSTRLNLSTSRAVPYRACVGLLTATSLLSFFSFVNPMLWFKYCPKQAAPGLILLFANPACVTLSVSEAYSRCTSGYLPCPSFQNAASAASAASSTLLPFPVLHHSSANACTPWALEFELRLAPGRRVPNSTHRHFQSISRKIVFLLSSHTATGLLSNSAFSVVHFANVHACITSLQPAKPRAGSSSLPASLSRSARVSRQHTVRLGRLSALPYPAPSLVSSCFPWPLPVATYRLSKSSCRVRHMEQTRRAAGSNLVPSVSLAAYLRTG
jgi:hypothetical protein